jgi:hypothetical protein
MATTTAIAAITAVVASAVDDGDKRRCQHKCRFDDAESEIRVGL